MIMARRPGINLDRIVSASLALIQADGEQALTFSALAQHFGIKPPSLYNHVGSLPLLRREIRLRGLNELHDTLREAVSGRAGMDALGAVCHAYRAFAQAQPALYNMTLAATEQEDAELQSAGQAILEVVQAVTRGYPLADAEAVHAVRCLRSGLHGFVALEIIGGFAMPLSADDSFERLIRQLDRMLSYWG